MHAAHRAVARLRACIRDDDRDSYQSPRPYGPFIQAVAKVVMDDGSEEEFGAGDIMMLPPGHDAWTVSEEPCVFVEFSQGNDYYAH